MADTLKPEAWLAEDLDKDQSWVHRLSPAAITGFEAALRHVRALGKPWLEMSAEDFPLNDAATDALNEAFAATRQRWGLCLLKGFPVEKWSEDEAKLVYWGIGLHVGVARTQNRASDVMTDVRDVGATYKTKNGRGYNTNAALDFHADSCDVVALMCLQTAKSGGQSKVSSSIAVCEEIGARHPELLEVLRRPFYHSYQGTQAPGQPPYYQCPIVGSHASYFALRANRKNTVAAQRDFPELPRLTPQEEKALDLLDSLFANPRFCYNMWLERGDLQLLNNYVVLHSRTSFDDYPEIERRRHLLRLWLSIPGSQPLPDDWKTYFGNVHGGSVRGGVRGSGITQDFLDYESRQAKAMRMPLILPQ